MHGEGEAGSNKAESTGEDLDWCIREQLEQWCWTQRDGGALETPQKDVPRHMGEVCSGTRMYIIDL